MTRLTRAAARWTDVRPDGPDAVVSRGQLALAGVTHDQLRAQLAARRWQLVGQAIVLHNGELTVGQRERVALITCGPRAVLTSFTAAARWGLRNWSRDEIHVLAPGGTTAPGLPGVVLHRTRDWSRVRLAPARRLHRLAPALVVAAASFTSARPACGLLATGVQQRLITADELRVALAESPRVRHRAALRAAVEDIALGAHALSEIDLRALCRRFGLPLPTHQAVRVEPDGRRRYLDAEWRTSDGRLVAVEVDGAHHLDPLQAGADSLRQNAVVLGGAVVLRFPAVMVRCEPLVVATQLARALGVELRLPR